MAHSLLPRRTFPTIPTSRLGNFFSTTSGTTTTRPCIALPATAYAQPCLSQGSRARSTLTAVSQSNSERSSEKVSARRQSVRPSRQHVQTRSFHSTRRALELSVKSHPPKSRDRGPASKEDTQTDFSAMNMLGNMAPPSTAVDACLDDGFALDSGLKVVGAGVLLVGGEAFKWRPWSSSPTPTLRSKKGMFEVDKSVWGVLDLVWPKPDLLILGTGEKILPVSPQTRRDIAALGIRIEVQDTRNAAAQFNMLATERGTQQVAAALVPVGWREGK